jgi:hypothetical protein
MTILPTSQKRHSAKTTRRPAVPGAATPAILPGLRPRRSTLCMTDAKDWARSATTAKHSPRSRALAGRSASSTASKPRSPPSIRGRSHDPRRTTPQHPQGCAHRNMLCQVCAPTRTERAGLARSRQFRSGVLRALELRRRAVLRSVQQAGAQALVSEAMRGLRSPGPSCTELASSLCASAASRALLARM